MYGNVVDILFFHIQSFNTFKVSIKKIVTNYFPLSLSLALWWCNMQSVRDSCWVGWWTIKNQRGDRHWGDGRCRWSVERRKDEWWWIRDDYGNGQFSIQMQRSRLVYYIDCNPGLAARIWLTLIGNYRCTQRILMTVHIRIFATVNGGSIVLPLFYVAYSLFGHCTPSCDNP